MKVLFFKTCSGIHLCFRPDCLCAIVVFFSSNESCFFFQVIELNLRASRSIPFASKTINTDLVSLATRIMTNAPIDMTNLPTLDNPHNPEDYVGIKVRLWDLYCKTSNISCTLVCNKIVDYSDVVRASPVCAAPTTSSYLT